jgi:regulator of nucleoside diphosphate kinase
MHTEHTILISSEDAARLQDILSESSVATASEAELLDDELARATIVPAESLPDGVVSMNSRVVFEDLDTGQRREIVLVYPREADISAGRVSVLTSLGSALLGLSVGQEITWPMPRGRQRRVRVLSVLRPVV